MSFVREKPLGAAGGIILVFMVLVALVGPLVAPADPLTTNVMGRLAPPSSQHLLGTDELGRDLLSRLIYGARVSMLVGVLATVLGSGIGALLGIVSGYLGGRVDMVVQRFMDVLMAFPPLVLALALMAVMGPSVPNVIVAISVAFLPRANRVVRAAALAVKELQYIEAARAVGATRARIIFVHVVPNCLASYLIIASVLLGASILVEASLSFLGLGVPPPHPSWGRSLSESMQYFRQGAWLAIFPGIAISLAVFGANLFGDALRDMWDPRLKRL
ncbi:MAG: ABC transporter permease [Chloroflexota bacterium]